MGGLGEVWGCPELAERVGTTGRSEREGLGETRE